MKTLEVGTAILLGAGIAAIGCHSEKEPTMQPAARSEPAPAYGAPEMGAQQQQPAMSEPAESSPDTSGGSTWASAPSGSTAMSPDAQAAADKIVTARCERETTCNNIGAGRKYPTRDACSLALNAEIAEALASTDCAGEGKVDTAQLVSCVSELKKESCNSGLGAVENVVECRLAALCGD